VTAAGGRTALLLTGTGRYADPWHPFEETTAALESLLSEAGFSVTIPEDVDTALERLADDAPPSLLAVNIGLPRDGRPSPGTPEARAGLSCWLSRGGPLLAAHVSSTSLLDLPEWEVALGGRWVRGTSMHPDYGPARINLHTDSGPLVQGLQDFELMDERYCYLRTSPEITVHATHHHEGIEHPVIWSLTRNDKGRTFYDALGHDSAAYTSPEHRELLSRAIAWLASDSR
jgi:uncharacterized protein